MTINDKDIIIDKTIKHKEHTKYGTFEKEVRILLVEVNNVKGAGK